MVAFSLKTFRLFFYYGTENEEAIQAGAGSEWGIEVGYFIFYPKTSQLPVWDTDVNRCCGDKLFREQSSTSGRTLTEIFR